MYEYRAYTGIGSRKTPPVILEAMEALAGFMAQQDFTLRSGAAEGADAAFERGATEYNGRREIYLPWPSFNGHHSKLEPKQEAYAIAESFHPNWPKLYTAGRKLMARNVHQILGVSLQSPTNFVVCWTPNGKLVGGTALAINIALANNIPVINLGALTLENAQAQIMELV